MMNKVIRWANWVWVAAVLAGAGIVHAQSAPSHPAGFYAAAQAEGEGTINSLDFEKYTIVVGGTQYDVSQTVRVEIGGSYGAFTLLKAGMKVRFDYLQYPNGRNEIVQMFEDNNIEES